MLHGAVMARTSPMLIGQWLSAMDRYHTALSAWTDAERQGAPPSMVRALRAWKKRCERELLAISKAVSA